MTIATMKMIFNPIGSTFRKGDAILNVVEISDCRTCEGCWYAHKEGMQEGYNAALQSIRNKAAIEAMGRLIGKDDGYKYSPSEVADYAVHYADALEKALKQKMEE